MIKGSGISLFPEIPVTPIPETASLFL